MRKKPDNYFGKAKRMFEKEKWSNKKNKWLTLVNCLEDKLRKLNDNNLQKEKLEAQANLKYCELRNENSAIKYGLPVASLAISAITLLYSIIPTIVEIIKKHTSDAEEAAKEAADFATNSVCAFFFLVAIVTLLGVICIICELIRNSRQKQIIYYQTKLQIIESIEKNEKNNSVCNPNSSEKKQKDKRKK